VCDGEPVSIPINRAHWIHSIIVTPVDDCAPPVEPPPPDELGELREEMTKMALQQDEMATVLTKVAELVVGHDSDLSDMARWHAEIDDLRARLRDLL
jgi:hypothetical protein